MEELEMNTEISGEESVIAESEEASAENIGAELDFTPRFEENGESEDGNTNAAVDYGEIEKQDLEELRAAFPHLKNTNSITELDNPLRYAALRDLGLSPKEAYLATSEPVRKYDNRSHLRSSVPRSAAAPSGILTRSELEAARELFSGLSDGEIQKLYKKVSR